MKKLISLVLAVMMVIGLFAGCNTDKPVETNPPAQTNPPKQTNPPETTEPSAELEPATLVFYYQGKESEKSADVVKAFNKKLAELLPNTTVEFVFDGDIRNNWPLVMAGGEVMDLAWVGYKTPMLQDTLDGNLLALDDLVAQYGPNILKEQEIWTDAYNTGILNGTMFAVPCVQPNVPESQSLSVSDKMIPFTDMNALVAEIRNNWHATENLLDIIETSLEGAIAAGVLVPGADDWIINKGGDMAIQMGKYGYLGAGPEGNQIYFDPSAEEVVLYHLYEIPEVKMILARMAEWYEKGWFSENAILNQLPSNVNGTIGANGAWNSNWAEANKNGVYYKDTKATAKDGQGSFVILTNRPEEGYKGTNVYGRENTYMAIPYTAQHPERAMMLLNLLHDEVGTPGNDLYNMLCYGFEKNSPEAAEYGWYSYEAVEQDGQIVAANQDKEKHLMTNWVVGNTYKCLSDGTAALSVDTKDYCMNFYTNVYPALKESPISGMTIDFEGLGDYISAYQAVVKEYKTQVGFGVEGVDGWEALYNEFINKMYEAGLGEVKDNIYAQIEKYVG